MRIRALLTLVVGLLAASLVFSGCSTTEETKAAAETDYAAIIDVRTPGEYLESHVQDAINIDVQDPSFDARIAELPKDGTYLVYCRSGNRSAAAAERLKAAGLDVVDGGGLTDMQNAGFPFVDG